MTGERNPPAVLPGGPSCRIRTKLVRVGAGSAGRKVYFAPLGTCDSPEGRAPLTEARASLKCEILASINGDVRDGTSLSYGCVISIKDSSQKGTHTIEYPIHV